MTIFTARKRPVEVQIAGPWDGTDAMAAELVAFTGDDEGSDPDFDPHDGAEVWNSEEGCWISVPPGHFIIRGPRGEHYPISPEALAETYDLIETADV